MQTVRKITLGLSIAIASLITVTKPARAIIFDFETTTFANNIFGTGWSAEGTFSYTPDGTIETDDLITFSELDNISLTVFNGNDSSQTTISGKSSFGSNDFNYVISSNTMFLNRESTLGDSSGGLVPNNGVWNGFVGYQLTEDGTNSPDYTRGGGSIAHGAEVFSVSASTASVPFEFSPTLGILAVGSIFGVSRLRKKTAVKLDR